MWFTLDQMFILFEQEVMRLFILMFHAYEVNDGLPCTVECVDMLLNYGFK
jgi:hypothetical protein